MGMNSTRLSNSSDTKKRGPARLLFRVLLIVVGLFGVVAVPVVACWRALDTLEPIEGPGTSVDAPDVSIPDISNLEDVVLNAFVQIQGQEMLAPISDDPTPVPFTVAAGENAAQIAQRLQDEGLIRDANFFRALLRIRGIDTQLEVGEFLLRRNMSMDDIVVTLQNGRPPTVVLTIPEGWRIEQIAGLLRVHGLADPDEFVRLATEGVGFKFEFLEGRPADSLSLEGYLFPDTYEFDAEATAVDIINRMLITFGKRFTPEMREQVSALGLSIHEVVTLASIVEREAQLPEERGLISGVFYNRVQDGMYLNADPTIQYALGYQEDAGQWWKRPLYLKDLEYDSPYNTYTYPGLPPGPICNPGLASLEAATVPEDTEYYYFVANEIAGDGSHVFAITLEEHRANIEQYR